MKDLASRYHKGQYRKGEEKLPYIVHPQSVAETVHSWGRSETSDAVQIAWGHDLLEDTAVTAQEIVSASNPRVLEGIKLLTCPPGIKKIQYLKNLSESGNLDVLLVKTADRICNSRDFVKLKGALYAYQYLHEGDCLYSSLKQYSGDPAAGNALAAVEAFERSISAAARHDAIRGCMIGGAVGDALGAPLEFMRYHEITNRFGAQGAADYVEFSDGTGAVTDDTQMALFTAEGILCADINHDADPVSAVHSASLRWLATQQRIQPDPSKKGLEPGWLIKEPQLFRRRAPGNTCISALCEGKLPAENDSKGCGTVMRMAPVGLFYPPEEAYEYGCKFSAVTHGHPTGYIAGGAFAMLISFLLHGKSLTESLDLTEAHLQKIRDAGETLAAIRQARTAQTVFELGEGWIAEEALAIGIYCALKHPWNFEAGVLEAINISGDSDSTGSIAGNILGVMTGEDAIPPRWRTNLQEYRIVSELSEDLFQRLECHDVQIEEPLREKYSVV